MFFLSTEEALLQVPEESKVVINKNLLTHFKHLKDNLLMSDYAEEIWDKVYARLCYAKTKRTKSGDLIYIIPVIEECKKKIQRDYISYYGNQYDQNRYLLIK